MRHRPNCGIYHVYMTKGTDGKFHWVLKFVRITTKSYSVMEIEAFTKFNINLVFTEPISMK